MAIYHFHCAFISRSKGLSAVAVAGRRAGERLYDSRLGKKVGCAEDDVVFKAILLPSVAPKWMLDREKLWNAVEQAEGRKDSRLARDIDISLPQELSNEQNIKLATEFVQDEFVVLGMVADLCVHVIRSKDMQERPHMHIMLTTRKVDEDGFGLKEIGWDKKDKLMRWREAWAKYLNKYLALNGIEQRVDHRSNAERGIDLIPQNKVGSKHRKDVYRVKSEEHERIARENGEKILKDPMIILRAIACTQSVFTDKDLVKFIERYTVDTEQFNIVYEKVKASKRIIPIENSEKFTVALESG